MSPANEQDRARVAELVGAVQEVTHESVEVACVDQGYTGEGPREAAQAAGVELCVVKLEEARWGFVLLPRRWVVERSFGWTTKFRRLVRDYGRLPETLAGLHVVALICIMLARAIPLLPPLLSGA